MVRTEHFCQSLGYNFSLFVFIARKGYLNITNLNGTCFPVRISLDLNIDRERFPKDLQLLRIFELQISDSDRDELKSRIVENVCVSLSDYIVKETCT